MGNKTPITKFVSYQIIQQATSENIKVSDLQRAFKTCQLILEENQRSAISGEDVKKDKLLRERNFGIFEGKSYDLVAEFRKKYGEYHPIENGESGVDVENRIN